MTCHISVFFLNVWTIHLHFFLVVMVEATVDLHVSDPYRRTDVTLELKILIFVVVLITLLILIDLMIEKASSTFFFLAWTSSSVPPDVLMTLPRYVNSPTSSISAPLTLVLFELFALILIDFVLVGLM